MGIGDEASNVNETRDQATLNACDNLEGTGNHKRPAGWGSARALQKHLLHYLLLQWRRTYWLFVPMLRVNLGRGDVWLPKPLLYRTFRILIRDS